MRHRITFIGEELWASQLAAGLNKRFPNAVSCSVVSFQSLAAGRIGLLRLIASQTIVRVGFPPMRPTSTPDYPIAYTGRPHSLRNAIKRTVMRFGIGRSLREAVLHLRVIAQMNAHERRLMLVDRICDAMAKTWLRGSAFIYWIGSDVTQFLLTDKASPEGFRSRALLYQNITVTQHLSDELAGAGLESTVVAIPRHLPPVPSPLPGMPETFNVLSYIPTQRFRFYGGAEVITAAEGLPEARFKILCNTTPPDDQSWPENVEFVTQTDDMKGMYADCCVFLRMTEHDGCPATVAEALLFGRPVIHTYPRDHCIYVPHGDAERLTLELKRLYSLHEESRLAPSQDIARWAAHEYDEDRRFAGLLEALTGK